MSGAARRADRSVAAGLLVALAALGALLGTAWSAWSGPQPRAFVVAPGTLYPFDEVETFAAADGRFLVITGAVGLVAGLAGWFLLARVRGPLVAAALGVGGLAGAALTELVGHLTGGGTFDGRTHTVIAQLPLSLHMSGLVFVEGALAVLVYGVLAAFTSRDDLGRDEAVPVDADSSVEASVGAGIEAQRGGGDGDAAGAA